MKLDRIAQKDVVVLDRLATLDNAIHHIWHFGIRHLPIIADRGIVGIVSDRDLLLHVCSGHLHAEDIQSRQLPERLFGDSPVESVMTQPVTVLSPDDPIDTAARCMLDQQISAVPLTKDEQVVGIVTETDYLKCFAEDGWRWPGDTWRQLAVADRMCEDLVTMDPKDGSIAGIRTMHEHRIHHLPVMSEGQLVGIASDRDVLRGSPRFSNEQPATVAALRAWTSAEIGELMTPNPKVIDPASTLGEAARIMVQNRIGALPVVQDGRMLGIVTETDLIKTFVLACDN